MAGTVKKLRFSEGTDVGAPTDLSLATSTTVIEAYANDADYATANGAPMAGSVYVNTTTRTFKVYANGAWRQCWVEQDPADATKLLVKDLSGQATGVTVTIGSLATANRTQNLPDKAGEFAMWESGQNLNAPAAGNTTIGGNVGANNLTLGGASTTTVIPGNLQVQGTTTQVDTTNMNVKDQNILINDGGNDASAEGAGLTVERTGTNGSFVYEDALASKFKGGALGSESEFITATHVQTVENKRIRLETTVAGNNTTSPRLIVPSNTLANLQAISGANHVAEGSVYYATDVNKIYYWDGSTLRPVGSGGGSGTGDVNYIALAEKAFDFEADISGWNTYDDGAVAAPIDGTGGSPSVLTISRNTTTPLNGTADLKISKGAADAQGEGLSIDIPVPRGYQSAQQIGVSFLLDSQHASYVAGDLKVYVYDIDNASFRPVDVSMVPYNLLAKMTVYFDGTTSANYRLIFHVATTNANAWDLYIDDVSFGALKKQNSVAKITRWETYTPSYSAGTVVNSGSSLIKFRQIGESIELEPLIVFGAGSSGTNPFYFTLPNNWNAATDYTQGSVYNYGAANYYQSPSFYIGYGTSDDSNDDRVNILTSYNISDSFGSRVRVHAEGDFNSGDIMSAKLFIRIQELIGFGTLYEAFSDTEYASNSGTADANDSTNYEHGPAGSSGHLGTTAFSAQRYRDVEWIYDRESEDEEIIEISPNQTDWFPMIGYMDQAIVGYAIPPLVRRDATSNDFGVALEYLDPTHTRVWFGAQPFTANGFSTGWNGFTGFFWRVKRKKKGALGVGYATDTRSGVVAPYNEDAGVVYSGTWVAGDQGSSNIDGVSNIKGYYSRNGKVVTATITADIDATAAGTASVVLNVPPKATTTFTGTNKAIGVGVNIFDKNVGTVSSVNGTSNVSLDFTAVVTTSTNWMWHFQYEIE